MFGSWNAMVEAAGFTPRPKHRTAGTVTFDWTREQVIETMRHWYRVNGKGPTYVE